MRKTNEDVAYITSERIISLSVYICIAVTQYGITNSSTPGMILDGWFLMDKGPFREWIN